MYAYRIALAAIALATSIGCQGKIVPLSAQAGSTVLIPLGEPNENTGYGGTLAPDYQRGELVYRLGGPTGPELVTRATAAVAPVPNSNASFGLSSKRQVISLVDIPANAPVGTHTLDIVRRRVESGVPVDYPGPVYHGELTILPHELEFEVNGNPEEVVGEPTPFQRWNCTGNPPTCSFANFNPAGALPMPELRLSEEQFVDLRAVQLTIDYPEDVIDVFDVYEVALLQTNHIASVWFEDDAEEGVLHIGAVSSEIPILALGIAYTLDDGAEAILDAGDVVVTIDGAWDSAGEPITGVELTKAIY
jgi:hypothetical protein